jgi:histone acetyltransferase (RNA polymerase elongator complex component)
MKRHYIIPIFVPHAGCPHTCVFCNQKEITGQGEVVDAQIVEETIKSYLATIPGETETHIEVGYFGGSFTGIALPKQQELLTPAWHAKNQRAIQGIRLSTRPDYISKEILQHLAQYRVDTVEIGVQSLSDEVLAQSERGHTRHDVQRAVELIRQHGFRLGIQLMVGLPADNYERWMQTVQETIALKPDFIRIYPTLVLAETQLDAWMKAGRYRPLDLEQAVEWCRDGLARFRVGKIPVIRIGLQPTEEISPQARVTGGPYHPAFRQLVESSLDLILLVEALNTLPDLCGQEVRISVPRIRESDYRGQKNSNLQALAQKFSHWQFRLHGDSELKEPLFVLVCGKEQRIFDGDALLAAWVQGRQALGSVIQ